jgi:hypothetical protein
MVTWFDVKFKIEKKGYLDLLSEVLLKSSRIMQDYEEEMKLLKRHKPRFVTKVHFYEIQ